jgi:hypothetical protein
LVTYNDTEEQFELAKKMCPIWREAAELELSGDYYPMTECRCDPHDWYAMQFDNPSERRGFIQVIRNIGVKTDSIVIFPHVDESKTYVFTDPLGKRSLTVDGKVLARDGWCETLPHRSGVVWFYRKK